MTPEEVEAERERFDLWHQGRYGWTWDGDIAPDMGEDERARARWLSWLARAEIAHAEKAELVAENVKLRERARELAKGYLRVLLTLVCDRSKCTETTAWRSIKTPQPGSVSETLLQLAEEAGCWFDDDGNEVPLAEWRARQGGAG
jgi:hypothetical protein